MVKKHKQAFYLTKQGVKNDHVMDIKVHGGIEKACYLYSADHYPFWKKQFPNLDWDWGIFGENLTVTGMDDRQVYIGDVFEIGSAIIQVSEPRRPCSTLGIRFGTQEIVKLFNQSLIPGTYVRILQEGTINTGDSLKLIESNSEISVSDVFSLFAVHSTNTELTKKVIQIDSLSIHSKSALQKVYGIIN